MVIVLETFACVVFCERLCHNDRICDLFVKVVMQWILYIELDINDFAPIISIFLTATDIWLVHCFFFLKHTFILQLNGPGKTPFTVRFRRKNIYTKYTIYTFLTYILQKTTLFGNSYRTIFTLGCMNMYICNMISIRLLSRNFSSDF